jgi:hypothetical protein
MRVIALCLLFLATGCTSFATVRSAQVAPGLSTTIQASVASPPGDAAAWFWSFDCADECDHAIPSTDAVLAYGARTAGGRQFAIGGGINGVQPYVEAYMQLNPPGARPVGAGARVGSFGSWTFYQLYARSDWQVAADSRLLWNPGIYYHAGRAPNGESPGSFLGLVNGFGLESGAGPVTVTPSLAVVWGRAQRNSYGEQFGPTTRAFVTGAVSVGFRRDPRAP